MLYVDMLETLFNNATKERVLLYLYTHQEGYGKEMSRSLEIPLRSIQLQLKKLEEGGVLVCRKRDRTLVYQLNPRYPFYRELVAVLEKALSLLPEDERRKRFTPRLRPRRRGKPL